MKLTPATITTRNALESLRGTVCPFDERPKHVGASLCGRCYFSLGEGLRRTLYRPMRQGYEQALTQALTVLDRFKTPPDHPCKKTTSPGVRS
jgi:hypothetical protein